MSAPKSHIIKKRYPFADKFVFAVANAMNAFTVLAVLVSFAYILWAGWAFSAKLRELLDNTLWIIVTYIVAIAFIFILGILFTKFWPRLILGRAAFGPLGGIPWRMMSIAVRARANIEVELKENDKPVVKQYNIIQEKILHDGLKEQYEQIHKEEGGTDDDLEEKWKEIWKEEVLDMQFGGQSLAEAADVNKFGLNYAMGSLLRSTKVASVLGNLFWIVMVVLIILYSNQRLQLLTGIQIGVALAFLFTGFWYMFVMHNLTAVPLSFKDIYIPKSVNKEFDEEMKNLEGQEIRPKNIKVKPKFFTILRNYQFRLLFGNILSDIFILLLLLAAIVGVMYLIDAEYARMAGSHIKLLIYGILIAGGGLALSFYFFSIVLKNLRKVFAAVIAALLAAGLPFLIDYLLGGKLDISGLREAIFAGSGGLLVAIVTAVTSHVKESME